MKTTFSKTYLLVASGAHPGKMFLKKLVASHDVIVAVDGGASHLDSIGRAPDILIGDLDSIPAKLLQRLKKKGSGCTIIRHPRKKDAGDLELAIDHVISEQTKRKIKKVTITASLPAGSRMDQFYGTTSVLFKYQDFPVEIIEKDSTTAVLAAGKKSHIPGSKGKIFSIFPIGCKTATISLNGAGYKLSKEKIPLATRGLSNTFTGKELTVEVHSGLVIVFVNIGSRDA